MRWLDVIMDAIGHEFEQALGDGASVQGRALPTPRQHPYRSRCAVPVCENVAATLMRWPLRKQELEPSR